MTQQTAIANGQKTIQLNIVSIEEALFGGAVYYAVVNGFKGELGIYPGHVQLLTQLKPGKVRFCKMDNSQHIIYLSGGILEIQPNHIMILADTALRAEDIDEMAALKAKRNAEKLLKEKGMKNKTDYQQALIEIAESTAKLRAIKELHRYMSDS